MRQLKISKSITNRECDSLDKYFREIGKYDLVSIEEEIELATKIKQKDQAAIERLTKANLRFVVSVAKQYQNQGLSLADLINEGNLGLIKAAEKFDETRGFKFISYAVWWIRQSIMQAINEQSRIIRLPNNQLSTLSQYQREYNKFEQSHERSPLPDEISAILNIDDVHINELQRNLAKHVSYDTPLDNEDSDASTMVNVLENKEIPQTDNNLIKESFRFEIDRALKSTLGEKEEAIIRMCFGIGMREYTLDEIAELQNVSRERVRQIKEKSLLKLRESSMSNILKSYL